MINDLIFRMGYSGYLARTGLAASEDAEIAYRDECDKNRQKPTVEAAQHNASRIDSRPSLPILPLPFIKAGRLRENTNRGSIVHAVMSNGEDNGDDGFGAREALCGDAPKIGWSSSPGQSISCSKCLRRLS